MRFRFIEKFTVLLGALAIGSPALAKIPEGWTKVETTAFTMAIPSSWVPFRARHFDFARNPMLGAWYYMSKNAHAKLFVRIRPLKPGTIQKSIERSLKALRRKVDDVKPMGEPVIFPPDEKKRDAALLFYRGTSTARDKKTSKEGSYHHMIGRMITRAPDLKLRVTITYLFSGAAVTDPQSFVEQHLGTFDLQDPQKIQERVKKGEFKEEGAESKPAAKAPGS